jgi:hypothetical protein
MEFGTKTVSSLSKELGLIEQELADIWKLLSPSERQKRSVFHKMNRIQMTLHRLKYFHWLEPKTQVGHELAMTIKENK